MFPWRREGLGDVCDWRVEMNESMWDDLHWSMVNGMAVVKVREKCVYNGWINRLG